MTATKKGKWIILFDSKRFRGGGYQGERRDNELVGTMVWKLQQDIKEIISGYEEGDCRDGNER